MSFLIFLCVLAIIGIITAVVGSRGLWHSLITFFNVMTAALVATNYFEPISEWIDYWMPTFTFLIDFLVLWGLFALTLTVLRSLTDLASRVKVRFFRPVDLAGGYIISLWTGWVFVCFTMMALHTAALQRDMLAGGFQPTPDSRPLYGLAPDRQWLALVHRLSQQSLAAGGEKPHVFDPQGDFILRYASRRYEFEKQPGILVHRKAGQAAGQDPELQSDQPPAR